MRTTWFSRYILPGFILKAAIIGGGYVSGRELEQYFGSLGVASGLLGMSVAMALLSCVYAATLEFARVHRSYDYRSFFQQLLGRGWVVFEIAYVLMTITVISVLTSVAGTTLHEVTAWPAALCEAGFMAMVAFLLFFGTRVVEGFLSLWSFALYAAFGALVICSFLRFGAQIREHLQTAQLVAVGGAVQQGLKYTGYNIQAITAVLFCARHIRSRRDAVIGGLLGGPFAMLPGTLFYLAMSGLDPEIRGKTVPVEYLLSRLGMPPLAFAFLTVLAITLIGTCCALIHTVNERIAESSASAGCRLPGRARAGIAVLIMCFAVLVADRIGLMALVGNAYGFMAWVFIAIFLIPVLTVGIWKTVHATAAEAALT